MHVREAVLSDFPAITDIYNEIVANSTAVYSDTPSSLDDRLSWWRSRREAGYPLLVADQDGRLLGYATFGDFRPWPGYRFTVEGTIHLHPEARGHGVGKFLLNDLVAVARDLGKHTLIAGVDSENLPSQRFLLRYGFVQVGHLREVGYKFGRFLDLFLFQYPLQPPTTPESAL